MKIQTLLFLGALFLFSNIQAQENDQAGIVKYGRHSVSLDLSVTEFFLDSKLKFGNIKLGNPAQGVGLNYVFRLGLKSNITTGLSYSTNSLYSDKDKKAIISNYTVPLRFSYLIYKSKARAAKNGDLTNAQEGLRVGLGPYLSFNNVIEFNGNELQDNTTNSGFQIELGYVISAVTGLYLRYSNDFSPLKILNSTGSSDLFQKSSLTFTMTFAIFSTN
jgi:hypothetical protein